MSFLHSLDDFYVSMIKLIYDLCLAIWFLGGTLHKLLVLLILSYISVDSYAHYYDTLPKGVNSFVSRYIKSDINSSYNQSKTLSPFTFKVNADIKMLEDINDPTLNDILDVFNTYPDAYSAISLGTHKFDAKADVNVDVFALAYGITDRITAYVGVPIYKANVNINYTRIKNDSLDEVSDILQDTNGDDLAQTIGNIVENLYEVDESLIQSGIVNALEYDELGDWQGEGLGDTELGIMYNFLREKKYGMMATFGLVAPTGYVDDPDLLQDIGFGDGQWDVFAEFGGGYELRDDITINAWTRYTYQFASTKKLRVPLASDTNLGAENASFEEKLGNKILFGTNIDYYINDWFKLQPGLVFDFISEAEYSSSDAQANRRLAKDTESYSQNIKMLAQFSSLKLFKQKKFVLPAQINLSLQKMMDGKNVPKTDLAEIEFRFYF